MNYVLVHRHNDKKNFLVWINEEDHTRVISMELGGNMRAVFKRFCDGLNKVEAAMKAKGETTLYGQFYKRSLSLQQ